MSSRYYLTTHLTHCMCSVVSVSVSWCQAPGRLLMSHPQTDPPHHQSHPSSRSAPRQPRCYFMKHRAHLSSRISQETGNNKFFSGLYSCCLLHNSFTMVLSSVSLVRFVSVWLKDKKIQRPSGSRRHGNSPTTEPTGWFMMRKTSESDWRVGRADVSYYICISWWMRSHSTDVLTHQRFYTHWTEI